jgi:hypothetical protein
MKIRVTITTDIVVNNDSNNNQFYVNSVKNHWGWINLHAPPTQEQSRLL